jgi:hypothetical protein
MMGIPDLGALAAYKPLWPGVREHNLGDQWRAKFIDADEVPADAPVDYAYALLYGDGRGYVVRTTGSEAWGTVEGAVNAGETFDAGVKRLCLEQAGATIKKVVVTGFLECKATSHNPNYPVGSIVVRPFTVALASKVDDLPDASPYQRRRLPTNEHMVAIRRHYPDFEKYLGQAGDTYFVMAAKGEV